MLLYEVWSVFIHWELLGLDDMEGKWVEAGLKLLMISDACRMKLKSIWVTNLVWNFVFQDKNSTEKGWRTDRGKGWDLVLRQNLWRSGSVGENSTRTGIKPFKGRGSRWKGHVGKTWEKSRENRENVGMSYFSSVWQPIVTALESTL